MAKVPSLVENSIYYRYIPRIALLTPRVIKRDLPASRLVSGSNKIMLQVFEVSLALLAASSFY